MTLNIKTISVAGLLMCAGALAQAETYTLGITLGTWPTEAKKTANHFGEELNKATAGSGDSFKVVAFKNSKEAAKALAEHKIDLVYAKLKAYDLLKAQKVDAKVIAIPLTKNPVTQQNSTSYDSYFVTLKSNQAINNLQDLKGKSFLFNHKGSLSGYIYPVADLKAQGIDYEKYFSSYRFNTTHHRTLQVIKEQHLDAGAIWDNVYAASPLHDQFKIIYTIKDIPNPPVVGSDKLTDKQVKDIQAALTSVKAGALKDYFIEGFTSNIPDNFYDKALAAIKTVEDMHSVAKK